MALVESLGCRQGVMAVLNLAGSEVLEEIPRKKERDLGLGVTKTV